MIADRKFKPQRYGRLLAKALPGIIETAEENERMLAEVEKLWDKDLSAEEAKLFNLMVKLIQDFEDKHYDLSATSPLDILKQFCADQASKASEKAAGVNPQSLAINLASEPGNRSKSCGCEPAVLCYQPNIRTGNASEKLRM